MENPCHAGLFLRRGSFIFEIQSGETINLIDALIQPLKRGLNGFKNEAP